MNARRPGERWRIALKSGALLGVGLGRALSRLATTRDPLIAAHPMLEAIGRVTAQAGLRPEQYRHRGARPS